MPTPRVPLGSIDGNIRRRQLVTPFSRGYIEKGASNGESATSLGRQLGMHESTVRRTLKLNPLRVDGVTQPRSGRPPIACPRAVRRLLRLVRHEPTLTYAHLRIGQLCSYNLSLFSHQTACRIGCSCNYSVKSWKWWGVVRGVVVLTFAE
jgi:hypothetical protein